MSMRSSVAAAAPPAAAWRRRLPNLLTMLRLAMAVAFFLVLGLALPQATGNEPRAWWGNAAVALFIAGALTDVLDGWLARRWNAVTAFGRVMDPFVDKVLVLGAFVYLAALPSFAEGPLGGAMSTGVTAWMAVVLLARELLVTSLRGWLEGNGIAFPADPAGKAKMLLQSVAVPVCLFVAVHSGPASSDGWLGTRGFLVWATVVATVLSALPYVLRAIRVAPDDRS
jgi:CDP-diacylglycerol--glycerol-3-phosphate 3-phosphatidyltransferase